MADFRFGPTSQRNLRDVHHDLEILAAGVLEVMDIAVIAGARTIDEQIRNIRKGVSKTINSRHIPRDEEGWYDPKKPGHAIDVTPHPNPWPRDGEGRKVREKKIGRFYFMNGLFRMVAHREKIALVQGVDWDQDGDFFDQTFDDLPHQQLAVKLPQLRLTPDLLEEVNAALAAYPGGPLPPYRNP